MSEADDREERGAGAFRLVRTIGRACGIAVEVWDSVEPGDLLVVMVPTTEGFSTIAAGLQGKPDMCDVVGQLALRTIRLTGPLLTGERFRARGACRLAAVD